jgi:hypothetical protein
MDLSAAPDAHAVLASSTMADTVAHSVAHSVAWLGTVAGLATAAAAVVGGFLVRGSTAVPAAAWAVAAAVALSAEMAAVASGSLVSPPVRGSLRLLAAALAVCPTMSLLGAKRPQHGVWQFIVATLAIVLILPAVSATLVRPGTAPDVHVLARCFLLLLAIVGWMNFAGTRHAVAATLLAVGQVALSWPWLPFAADAPTLGTWFPDGFGVLLLAVGAAVAVVQSALAARTAAAPPDSLRDRYNRPFFALRETLGAAWTLRIAERFNGVSASRGWPCRLHFGGFDPGQGTTTDAWQPDAARAFAALLRRFVTSAWLTRHGWPSAMSDSRSERPILGPFEGGAV